MKRNRRNTLLWMKDLLDHMSRCHDQLQWASDGDTETFLADALIGDLNECQKLCEQLPAGQVATNGGRLVLSPRERRRSLGAQPPRSSDSSRPREIRVWFFARFRRSLPGPESMVVVSGHLFARGSSP